MEQRIRLLTVFFFVGFLAVIGKLFYWQVLNNRDLVALAENQYFTSEIIPASRGEIFSSDNFPLAMNRKSYTLTLDPQSLKVPPSGLFQELRSYIQKESWQISEKDEVMFSNKNLRRLVLATGLDRETKENIEKLKISGLNFEEKEIRFYPEASVSAQLLGFVGKDEKGNPKGYFGLEGYYDNEIAGQSGSRFFEKDALGRPVPLSEESVEPPFSGRSLVLSLDRPLQFLVEKRLKTGIEKYRASSGLVAIMNPKNGKIVAMASFPNYDPARYYLFSPELYRNPVISSSFEPGSIFKVIVMAAGIDSGAITVDDICSFCGGPKKIGEYTIRTWNDKYYPNSSMTDILVHSDNVGMTYVGEKLGVRRLYDYLKRFGFGEITGIDLQG
ncbi:MAG: peptidoglycan D,D-transpeptidase FtsI family protein, partial [Microgenomates group bacterium]